ncbi:MAG: AI-2E family transporter [Oxalobacteraceae bacterium]|jgi:predicted PurR-regulated permease PerM|nr:AI-2E family transporter [Oxalobacteraceae bacterium]
MSDSQKYNFPQVASYVLAAAALLLILQAGLLAALYSGLLVYALVHLIAPALSSRMSNQRARLISVAVLGSVIVLLLTMGVWMPLAFFLSDDGSYPVLLKKMADLLELSRHQIPDWLAEYLPDSAEALQHTLTSWMREHAGQAKHIGEQTGRTIAHLIIGMVIGAMAALYDTTQLHHFLPLASALHQRVVNLHLAFRQIVFAQVQIAAINALLTGVFLSVILPLAGIHLPFVKTLILITFVAGLLPVIGNLISNTAIVVISLSHSISTAGLALVFLVTVHKLEYFLNAKIVGTKINARAWEILSAMLLMESLFGVAGVIAAPVFYAYIKSELTQAELV